MNSRTVERFFLCLRFIHKSKPTIAANRTSIPITPPAVPPMTMPLLLVATPGVAMNAYSLEDVCSTILEGDDESESVNPLDLSPCVEVAVDEFAGAEKETELGVEVGMFAVRGDRESELVGMAVDGLTLVKFSVVSRDVDISMLSGEVVARVPK